MQPVSDLMAVMIGLLCGVIAGVPTSVLVLLALAQRDRYYQARQAKQPPAERPPLCWTIEQTGERTVEIGPADYRALLN